MTKIYDLLVIGGGINGTAIARDAAGRGLSVMLCEKDDLASHTSSASTKLIHGGLRYLEQYEFRLVRESLKEREVLLKAAPHIIWPLRFVLPYDKGLRPAWLLRLGLFLYDYIGGRKILPPTRTVNLLNGDHAGLLDSRLKKGFEYSDCWVKDARLVVLNAVDAKSRGADILTRTEVKNITEENGIYLAEIIVDGTAQTIYAKGIVNAAGPWVSRVLKKIDTRHDGKDVRLIKGSHIVTRKLFDGPQAYIFQNADNRIIFAIPYEQDYTLIGTTDVPVTENAGKAEISEEEITYLCAAINEYFMRSISKDDVVWSYSGIRPLFDDQSESASTVTRDYVLKLHGAANEAPFLSVYGGKITTSRKLAEHALEKLRPFYSEMSDNWTGAATLPGGDIPNMDFDSFLDALQKKHPDIDYKVLRHLARSYGTCSNDILNREEGPGRMFGQILSEAEVAYLVSNEFVTQADDILWRRTKLGLSMTKNEIQNFKKWFDKNYT